MRSVSGLDVKAPSPLWMQQRLRLAGMRPISLAVDVTNYVMLETGQPLHAYDRTRLTGPDRGAARAGRREAQDPRRRGARRRHRRPADHRRLRADRDRRCHGWASTEIDDNSTEIVIEAAHFDPPTIARSARRHKLPSEASRRFARGVDTALQEAAAERAVTLLAELGGAVVEPGRTVIAQPHVPTVIDFDPQAASRLVGVDFSDAEVIGSLEQIGCLVTGGETGTRLVSVPSWRPDLTVPADLVEEAARLHGYQHIPSELPPAPVSSGLTLGQRLRRRVGVVLAGSGYVEVQSYPFLSSQVHDAMGLPTDDPRRRALVLANPLSDQEPELRTSLLPGLFATMRRNVGRGADHLALFEIGPGLPSRPWGSAPASTAAGRRPSPDRRRARSRRCTASEAATARCRCAVRRA